MARTIVITSGKGGVGKTTITISLGRALAKAGKKVVLVDTDIGLNNLDVVLGVENKVVYDLVDIIENRCRPSQALIALPESKNLFVLPSVHSYDCACVDGQSIKAVVSSLKTRFDFVLIDCPAGIEKGFHRAVSSASEAIVVTTPHLSAVKDAQKVISLLRPYNLASVSLVLSRARGDRERAGSEVRAEDIERLLKTQIIGVIPDDDELGDISCSSSSPSKKSEGRKSVEMLCSVLLGGREVVYDAEKKYRGLLGKIKGKLKKIL